MLVDCDRTAREHIYDYSCDGQGRLEEAHYATDELGRQRAFKCFCTRGRLVPGAERF